MSESGTALSCTYKCFDCRDGLVSRWKAFAERESLAASAQRRLLLHCTEFSRECRALCLYLRRPFAAQCSACERPTSALLKLAAAP